MDQWDRWNHERSISTILSMSAFLTFRTWVCNAVMPCLQRGFCIGFAHIQGFQRTAASCRRQVRHRYRKIEIHITEKPIWSIQECTVSQSAVSADMNAGIRERREPQFRLHRR